MLFRRKNVPLVAIMFMAASCAEKEEFFLSNSQAIKAVIEMEADDSRVSVAPESLGGTLAYYWNPSDEIGVFTNKSENNLRYVNTNQTENVSSVTFTAAEGVSVSGTPKYAYYPFSATAGTDYSSLIGEIPQNQVIKADMSTIPGLYRYGAHSSTSNSVSTFTFKNLFAFSRFKIDATGTDLEGESLKNLDIEVTRNGAEVPFCGEFNFNARYGSYSRTGNVYNQANIQFEGQPKLNGTVIFVTSMFPTLRKNDVMAITLHTANYTASFDVKVTSYYSKNYLYTYNISLADATNLVITSNDGTTDDPEGDTEEGGNDDVTPVSGTFTCATYNVDGLPSKISFVSINADGPGATGTTNISAKIAQQGWDFVGFSEDFAYHAELMSSLSNYNFGTHRGNVSSSALYSTINTDGLGFAAKSGINFIEKAIVPFNKSAGGLTSGANTCIKKGFRLYVLTLEDGVEIDVYVTHMNTYSSSGSSHINAQHAQLQQLAEYINTHRNGRPIILMGDTNCRYTRHDFQTYFWSVLDSDLTYNDPWVEHQWNGVYPTYPSNSLMVSDATGTSNSDIICADTQKGEVVDKIIYINDPKAPVQIKAQSYLRDYDQFNGLADHMPIVATFSYGNNVDDSSNTNSSDYNTTVKNGGNAISW